MFDIPRVFCSWQNLSCDGLEADEDIVMEPCLRTVTESLVGADCVCVCVNETCGDDEVEIVQDAFTKACI